MTSHQTEFIDLERATMEYRNARDNYHRLVRVAFQEVDPQKREESLIAMRNENTRLVKIVEKLVQAWSELKQDERSHKEVDTLKKELEEFRDEMAKLQKGRDTIVQLQSVLNTLLSDNSGARTTYYIYIISVLILLVLVFVFFVSSYMRSLVSAVASSVPQIPTET